MVFTPRQIAPSDLQGQVLRGYARFYSLRRLLAHLVRLRFTAVRDYGWCWWFARRWRWVPFNRAYLKSLAAQSKAGDGSPLATEPLAEAGSPLLWRPSRELVCSNFDDLAPLRIYGLKSPRQPSHA